MYLECELSAAIEVLQNLQSQGDGQDAGMTPEIPIIYPPIDPAVPSG